LALTRLDHAATCSPGLPSAALGAVPNCVLLCDGADGRTWIPALALPGVCRQAAPGARLAGEGGEKGLVFGLVGRAVGRMWLGLTPCLVAEGA